MDDRAFISLIGFLGKIPGILEPIDKGTTEEGFWWVQFQIDIENEHAWNVVQELSCVLNFISLKERLPMIFYPVSPAPYLNGGPRDFLSWVIETKNKDFKPGTVKKWLEERLPNPVDDLDQWDLSD